jgi:transposase
LKEHRRFIGLDVHKNTIAGAIADGSSQEVRFYGEIANTPETVAQLAKRLGKDGGELHFCYEAGCCGYTLYRQLTDLGHACTVVAPALIPRKPGDRVKTDRRDCIMLARLHRAGELTSVWVPDASHEAMRDLVRGRFAAVRALTRYRQQLAGFLLRHGRIYPAGKKRWGTMHKRWIRDLKFDHPAQQLVLEDHFHAMEKAEERCSYLTERIREQVAEWSLKPLVDALQAMRGISLINAVTVVAEIGDISRFEHPSLLMAYVGLVPSEYSSGGKTCRGGITKTGNTHVRRSLVEGAWNYRMPPRISKHMMEQQKTLPASVREIAWKSQIRLHGRYRRMLGRGKKSTVVVTAVAREMVGFIWAIAREVQPVIKA